MSQAHTITWKTILVLIFLRCTAMAQGSDLRYQQDTAQLTGFFAPPGGQPHKKYGIVVVHAWMGIRDHEKNTVNKLSRAGYYALAADVYGNGRPADKKQASGVAGYYKKNPVLLQQRVLAAIQTLVKQGADPQNIVVIGYCFGGTAAIEAARADLPVKGVVSFHGGLAKDSLRPNVPVKTKVLILHGADDPHVPEKDIRAFVTEMREGKTDWQMIWYANAVHAFTDPSAGTDNSKGTAYNKTADERSWRAMLSFLKEVFD